MALSDPELELLRELLHDDPGADVWLQVGEELVRRGEWVDAEAVLTGGLGAHPETEAAWPLLARASLEMGHIGLALASLENVPLDPSGAPEAARVRMLALERAGRKEDARTIANAILGAHGNDVVASSLLERLDGAVVAGADVVPGRAPDPFVSMDRAERYIAVGRPDRAVRVYRRILFHNPGFKGAEAALRDLGHGALTRQMTEDLSEELINPASMPPSLDMPSPALSALIADEEVTEPHPLPEGLLDYARGGTKNPKTTLPDSFDVDDDEMTDPFALEGAAEKLGTKARAPRRRRRRRSLLNR